MDKLFYFTYVFRNSRELKIIRYGLFKAVVTI